MKKVLSGVLLAVLFASAAFADATADLFKAVEEDVTVDVVQGFIKAGADLKATDEEGKTILVHAAGFRNNPAIFQALLEAGADASAKDKDGHTAKDYATASGSTEIAKLFN
ncbi:MAG: ankyrin repeat domain-containing protein [Synergistaceae bacterium]|nr:ankyrin repeat domain-containing protein [Synergistaceae bacterium]MBQ6972643.1 ankyrin repeat domain-containing protein [Synergistaceae bacterium]